MSPVGIGAVLHTSTPYCTTGLACPPSLPWKCWTQSTKIQILTLKKNSKVVLTLCVCVRVRACRFADTEVRRVAVSWIEQSSDDELADYLPQLVQVQTEELLTGDIPVRHQMIDISFLFPLSPFCAPRP